MAIQQTLLGLGGSGGFYEGSGGQSTSDVTIGGVDYRVHTFTSVGSHTFSITKKGGNTEGLDVLLVAGGGGGGGRHGGGGGGGGVQYVQTIQPNTGNYTIVVGGGGARGGQSPIEGQQGGNSTGFGETAIGGGGGSGYGQSSSVCWKQDGGSGGGEDSRFCKSPGASTQGNAVLPYGGTGQKYGNAGAQASAHQNGGGGGAGAGGGGSGRLKRRAQIAPGTGTGLGFQTPS